MSGYRSNEEHCICCGQVIPEGRQVCIICGREKPKKKRQIDLIKNMSVDELAEFILLMGIGYISGQAPENIKQWLESEVEE